jgi:hypothetical protein
MRNHKSCVQDWKDISHVFNSHLKVQSVQLLKSVGIAFQYIVALSEKADFTVSKGQHNPL